MDAILFPEKSTSSTVEIPEDVHVVKEMEDLCSSVFPPSDLNKALEDEHNSTFFDYRIILTASRQQAAAMDKYILSTFSKSDPLKEYYSANAVRRDADAEVQTMCTPEYMSACSGINFPPSTLKIRKGMPLVLLKTLNVSNGLRKGARVIVIEHSRLSLYVRLIGVPTGADKYAIIPRVLFDSDPSREYPFTRRQFPVRPSFTMSIRRSQGEYFEHVGVDLRESPLLSSQPRMAFSRARQPQNLHVLLDKGAGRTFRNRIL